MPLRAFVDGEAVTAPLVGSREWKHLQQRVAAGNSTIVLPCCGGEGYLRRSKQGLQHFVHRRGETNCDWKPESWQHIKAKTDIILACKAAGYNAEAEVAENNWRADVLATRNSTRIAFEVQWSKQSLKRTVERQARFTEAGVRGCWFFRQPPTDIRRDLAEPGPELDAREDLPLFPLEVADNGKTTITLYGRCLSLQAFVVALLSGDVTYCDTVRVDGTQKARVIFFEMPCQSCGEMSHLYFVDLALRSHCGLDVRVRDEPYLETFAFDQEIIDAAQRYAAQIPQLRMGDIKPRQTGMLSSESLCFGCHHCDAGFDPFAVRMELSYWRGVWLEQADWGFETTFTPDHPVEQRLRHWCYPEDGVACCDISS